MSWTELQGPVEEEDGHIQDRVSIKSAKWECVDGRWDMPVKAKMKRWQLSDGGVQRRRTATAAAVAVTVTAAEMEIAAAAVATAE